MVKDCNWTKPHCNTSHMCRNGIQSTVVNYENFVILQVFSWHTYRMSGEFIFFKKPLDSECYNDKNRFWNCGDKAMEFAKTYAEGADNYKMSLYKNDMSRFA